MPRFILITQRISTGVRKIVAEFDSVLSEPNICSGLVKLDFERTTIERCEIDSSTRMRDGELLEQTPLVQPTKENESGLWLTPKATDTGRGEKSETFVRRMGDRGAHCFQSLPSQVGGKLNPEWVEWLMGWPIGWTDCAALETDKYRQWRQRHGGFFRVLHSCQRNQNL